MKTNQELQEFIEANCPNISLKQWRRWEHNYGDEAEAAMLALGEAASYARSDETKKAGLESLTTWVATQPNPSIEFIRGIVAGILIVCTNPLVRDGVGFSGLVCLAYDIDMNFISYPGYEAKAAVEES